MHEHTHLYTSDEHIVFPGRVFQIEEVLPYNKKSLHKFKGQKANVTIRNFPESVAVIRKKHLIKDGGSVYLFFTKNLNNELIVAVCSKIAE